MNFENLRNLMQHFVKDGYAPGNNVLVFIDGKEKFRYTCGYSDVENKIPMTGMEHFNLYSCTKITTVVAALKLFERGKFLLSDPLWEYMPEYKTMYVKKDNGEICEAKNEIKILNLFNMTAGFTYDEDTPAIEKARELTDGAMDNEVVAKCLSEEPLAFEPGERFLYSLCHDVLACFVEKVSGMKFRDYVRKNIFEPLGMDDTAFHLTDDMRKNMAAQYRFVFNKADKEKFNLVEEQKNCVAKNGYFVNIGINRGSPLQGPQYESGGAGLISTADDYIKLAAALANLGTGINGERILAPNTVELMRTNSLTLEQMPSYDWKQLKGYGYGLGVRTLMDKITAGSLSNIGEFGWGGAAGASVFIDPSIGLSAIYLKHTVSPREPYYMPRVRNAIYSCL